MMLITQKSIFDYEYTCPIIDKEIERTREAILYSLENYSNELVQNVLGQSNIPEEEKVKLIDKWTNEIFKSFSEYFETVRKTNQGMREVAENEVSKLNEIVESLEDEICEFKEAMEELEDEIRGLNNYIQELEDEITELKKGE